MIMNDRFLPRLWILIGALLLVAGGTILGLSAAWKTVRRLETKLTSSQLESFQLAGEVRRGLQSLSSSMVSYVLVRDAAHWAQFEQTSANLDHWIDDHDPSVNPRSVLSTEKERRVFRELNTAYDDYLSAARAVHSNARPALVSSGQLTQLDGFNAQALRMRELVRELADAHRAAESAFLASATSSLTTLRNGLIASIIVLLTLVAALGWVIYRDRIAPLRSSLVHSQTLLERQEKLATLGTLAAGIAHEIRNPLTSMKARLYTLEKHLQTVPAARKDTAIIGAEITRLERIVQDVLSFARPSEPKLESVVADRLLREVYGLMSQGLESRGVRLIVEPSVPLVIHADSGHLKQVLVNLVRNGAEAIAGEGTVTLHARAARAPLGGRETDAVIIDVADSGRGISPEVEKRLFDPFFSTKETGTGLGLSIATRIVEKHGGVLEYKTRPGHGTTFGVVLPREIEDSGTSEKSKAAN